MTKFPRIDNLKMLFGFLLLVILGGLAMLIAFGKVSNETSFGLEPIITTLATLAGAFAGWAFKEKSSIDAENKPEPQAPQPPQEEK